MDEYLSRCRPIHDVGDDIFKANLHVSADVIDKKDVYKRQTQYRDKLIKAMVSEGDRMNFSSCEGDGINQKEIIDLAETLPFFADKRVILIEDEMCIRDRCTASGRPSTALESVLLTIREREFLEFLREIRLRVL